LLEEEKRGKDIASPESSSDDEDDEATDTDGEGSGKDVDDSSSNGSDTEEVSEHEENSSKVDITGSHCRNIWPLWQFVQICKVMWL
jgi:hypothetical protein